MHRTRSLYTHGHAVTAFWGYERAFPHARQVTSSNPEVIHIPSAKHLHCLVVFDEGSVHDEGILTRKPDGCVGADEKYISFSEFQASFFP